jgi:hypothetical protein
LDVLYPRIAKLKHFVAFDADQVVVLLVPIGFFELGDIFAKLMLGHQVAFFQ